MRLADLKPAAVALAMAASAGAGATQAEDIAAGRAKAQTCAVCHGPLGVAIHPQAPNLAGQPMNYLIEQLKAFRTGKRRNEMMDLMAKPLTDSDIELLAAWFSAIRIEATPP
jgi:cytochrome c553